MIINTKQKNLWIGAIFVLVAGIFIGFFAHSLTTTTGEITEKAFLEKNSDEKRDEFVSEKEIILAELADKGKYSCCLEKPCTYCLIDEGSCQCAQEVLEGKHPCGECIGEILEGKGEPSLAPYFATAIAEKIGKQHTQHLKEIIAERYPGVSIEDQA